MPVKEKAKVFGNFLDGDQSESKAPVIVLTGISVTFFLPFFYGLISTHCESLPNKWCCYELWVEPAMPHFFFVFFLINNASRESGNITTVRAFFKLSSPMWIQIQLEICPLSPCLNEKYSFILKCEWPHASSVMYDVLQLFKQKCVCVCVHVCAAGEDWPWLSPTQALIKELLIRLRHRCWKSTFKCDSQRKKQKRSPSVMDAVRLCSVLVKSRAWKRLNQGTV